MRGLEDNESDRAGCDRSPTEMSNGAGVAQKPLTLLDRLRLCQSAWALGGPWDRESIHTALWRQQPGSFLVLLDSTSQPQLLCLSVGGHRENVKDFPIQRTDAVFHLLESHLGFSDLVQLVAFYSLSRDVLPGCLFIPQRVFNLTQETDQDLSLLGPKFWLCLSSNPQQRNVTPPSTGLSMCSIQVTSANGALCVINPLYLHEHGDSWLIEKASPQRSPSSARRPFAAKRERRLSTTRPWKGAGLRDMRGPSLDHEASTSSAGCSVPPRTRPNSSPSTPVVLRRASQSSSSGSFKGRGQNRLSADGEISSETTPLASPVPQSPHRVSWIEDGIWLSPPPLTSLLHAASHELDSLSISSLEEESDSTPSPIQVHSQRFTLVLADKVKNRLSAVGQAIGGLVSPQKRLNYKAQELSERKSGAFAESVKAFVEKTLRAGLCHACGSELLQEVRTALSSLREMLLESPEIQLLIDSLGDVSDLELDGMLELAIHKVALKPVCASLYASLQDYHHRDGFSERLKQNQHTMEGQKPEELGGALGVGLPDAVVLEKIQQRWDSMHEAYSPSKKVQILLKVCKTIYHSMNTNSTPGTVYGADDFLPCLTWVVLHSDITTLKLDTDYMMELLDPMLLQGEGGYYLTSLYGSLFHISSFRPRLVARQLSTEAQHSLSQWHRRRTLHCDRSRRTGNRRTIRRPASREVEPGSQGGAKLSDCSGEGDAAELPSFSGEETCETSKEVLGLLREEDDSRDEAPGEVRWGHDRLSEEGGGPKQSTEAAETLRERPTGSPEDEKELPHGELRSHDVLWTVPEDISTGQIDKNKATLDPDCWIDGEHKASELATECLYSA
ncbi:ras and Rab interactor 3 [Brienomyrus brachyistius]|uniref:ras and Rab interactor 3 n=1 Tax=Brienomyrus brachyistius TaxID=42636 RepID=UPI0020B3B437|nr:ras and Rab interactor 3 [Brienomyrus brachyistius]XP_048836786.1 ras and Rab interactor 3 [Brienomyrus brachyistius]XP_048836787.1 ras and Rab interactor 3 [Brienomyrus brachyistius]XP_048836788.1 ras and Rab interactor 3 [Brienomyrus brachyistius]